MGKEYSAGAVIYRKQNDTYQFLIVQSVMDNKWGFPKGHIENQETPQETAKREVKEEVGLNPHFDFNFQTKIEYQLFNKNWKEVTFFLAKDDAKQKVVTQPEEIKAARWISSAEAGKYLTEHGKADVLAKAEAYINQNE